jgi:hypothetical protein
MKKIIFCTSILLTVISNVSISQGCVAIRNLAGFGQFAQLGYGKTDEKWMLNLNNRYFEAWRFLQGKKDISPTDASDNINLYEYTMNLGLSHLLKNGWVLELDVPVSANTVASKAEHASGERHSTHAYGIGDVRFTVYKWLLNTKNNIRGNIQAGLGLKLPTGNYHTEDYFYTNANDKTYKELAPVNVAIQLGDGGLGITTELNAFYIFSHTISVYGNFFYLISPKDQNGVAAIPPGLLPPPVVTLFHAATYDVNSVPDNYTIRVGGNFSFNRFVATGGLRYEGAAAHDLIGQNNGLRRVGHIFSAEPGIQYKFKRSFVYSFVSLPLDRATIKTVPDERMAKMTGVESITPGHFANYIVYLGVAFKL